MNKKLILLAVVSFVLTGCSLFERGVKNCPPQIICPPIPTATPCPTPEPIPEPTPCPEPPPVPSPTPCPDCPPQKECPPEKICPPEKQCPPEKVCPPIPTPCPPEKVCPDCNKIPSASYLVPENSVLLWEPDLRCPPVISQINLPTKEKARCLQIETSKAVADIIAVQKIMPKDKSPCWLFAPNNLGNYYLLDREKKYADCLKANFDVLPGIGYGRTAHYLKGMVGSTPWEGCAAGVSGNPIRVSLVEPWRVNALISWETGNYYFWLVMDRIDLADGDLVGIATKKALAACDSTAKTNIEYTFDNLVKVK